MSDIAVIGAGAWGTALAIQAHRAGNAVTLWSRTALRDRRSRHLPDYPLPPAITLATTLPNRADVLVVAVPLQNLGAVLTRLAPVAPILLCAKGVETGTLRLPLEILAGCHPAAPSAVLTGPNFASEIAAGLPAAAVVAAADPALRASLLGRLSTPGFRLYGNDDPIGAQLGGAAKNVIAIAAGAVIGAGLGENARAALITRGLAELARLITAQGGRAETAAGLSGLGDLLLTCTGPQSRNFRCGVALGRGTPLARIVAESSGIIEGIATAPALVARAAGIDLPICQAVAALLAGETTVAEAIASLLSRPPRDE